jgi:MPBQ/MSBQ methyltransferase
VLYLYVPCAQAGPSPLQLGPKAETSGKLNSNPITFAVRMALGVAAGFYYFVLPIYMYLKNLVWPKNWEM